MIHSDPHSGNAAYADSRLVLIDLETVCLGPIEWDLALLATYRTSPGWLSPGDYADFVAAYGAATGRPHRTTGSCG